MFVVCMSFYSSQHHHRIHCHSIPLSAALVAYLLSALYVQFILHYRRIQIQDTWRSKECGGRDEQRNMVHQHPRYYKVRSISFSSSSSLRDSSVIILILSLFFLFSLYHLPFFVWIFIFFVRTFIVIKLTAVVVQQVLG